MTDAPHDHNPALDSADARRAGAILTIDLSAIQDNWRLYQKQAANAEAAAVIKAGGYGLDAKHVGVALAVAGCKTFFVATIDEGIHLRTVLGPEPSILILSGFMDGAERDLTAHHLIPVLNSLVDVDAWRVYCVASETPAPAALHIDTGMSRLGLDKDELAILSEHPDRLSGMGLKLIMSHLASAEEPDNPTNKAQLTAFKAAVRQLPDAPASLCNSSGVFLGTDYHFDMVRPGAALFGVNPTPAEANPMAQVVRLQGKILQVRSIDTPESVGYGSTHQAAGPTRIATIAAGYADGLNRSLSNNGVAYIGEHPAPFVGRVSMDLITLDVSKVPETLAHPGALVDLIGPLNPVDDVAEKAGTIGYEILTSLGERYHRIYATTEGS